MTLASLLREAPATASAVAVLDARAETVEVKAVAYDSRRVERGSVFVAMRGERADGTAFAQQAVTRGAVAVVAEAANPGLPVPWIAVPDARRAIAELSAAFYRYPSASMQVIGITGTNGKTTTSYLLQSIFEAAGLQCGRIGTVGYSVAGKEREALHTTPEAPDLHGLLREMLDGGTRACAMEVSSHALSLRRVDAMRFAAAIFTNLTRDHLDFHGNMESYFDSKRRLFEMLQPDAPSIINLDDAKGSALAQVSRRPVTYAIENMADVTPESIEVSIDGVTFQVRSPRGGVRVRSRLVGRPNVYNILSAVAAALALDLPVGSIEQGVENLRDVPGRFQVVSGAEDDVRVVVDYAHTDDALRNLLETARPLAEGRIITVFGCGGDRDRTKRPLMGAVAARLSDVVVLTSDNPRSEDPDRIIDDIQRGIAAGARSGAKALQLLTIPDRRGAIDRAMKEARPGDLVLVAGKGHERTQTIGNRVLPFDDVEVARLALARRRTRSRV
ncbi:MAG TPA: UDP-N-acetylmuramoyl-L-alanyl-D-glutamate--2,6-diaminopimelate ligase [Vicinamibacterales bacterium]|nr:UDP-N-acetylmuramoyl-L-alanyl-D-glutamate--2,6-diaminopimelate ligase [Vicinamibacterales bacterium]